MRRALSVRGLAGESGVHGGRRDTGVRGDARREACSHGARAVGDGQGSRRGGREGNILVNKSGRSLKMLG